MLFALRAVLVIDEYVHRRRGSGMCAVMKVMLAVPCLCLKFRLKGLVQQISVRHHYCCLCE